MSDQQQGWQARTQGGLTGHRIRRLIHVSMCIVPWLYWMAAPAVAGWIWLSPRQLLWVIIVLITLLELLRLSRGLLLVGQRLHEKKQLSSLFWGTISIALVLLYAPGPGYAVPIITVCAWVDPLLGEMRVRSTPGWLMWVVGLLATWLIWFAASYFLGNRIILGAVCGFLAVYFEQFTWKWIDDNALMQLVPLFFLLLIGVLF